jgi:DNA-3-methyladenine glycosylase II
MTPPYWRSATEYLTHLDPVIATLISSYNDAILINLNNPFHTLTRAVIGQQISIKAADKIWERLTVKLPIMLPNDFLKLDETELREIGLSRQKINYITNIATAFEQGFLAPNQWEEMSDNDVIKQLKSIKGIGQWTAEMFLIFHLHRPDVLPLADLGLINAIQLHYKIKTKTEIKDLSQRWKPYRTVATWYLWRSLDPAVVQY